ncbi:HEPN domain-containing protein [Hymenobacter psoromatis]|uniref:HEPN domain-containing protein n=1 Tax=Hymenobacter psoromatis TaxID=1484116 RepID=UPI001CBF60C0|nr:HEPN domain-containing protein [Hymenobacter psoromatis]
MNGGPYMQPLSASDKLQAENWLAIADLDLRVVERMHAEDVAFYGYHVPFACQQVVEKYAKAVLIAYQLLVRRTHDLPALLQHLSSVVIFSANQLDQADLLADYAVDIRYPPYQQLALPRSAGRFGDSPAF